MKNKYYLLDTNILGPLAEYKAGGSSTECQTIGKRWKKLSAETKIFLCPITIGEVESGLRIGPFEQPEYHKLAQAILTSFPCLKIDANTARSQYADLRARLYNKYAPKTKRKRRNNKKRMEEWIDPTTSKELQIQENDLWIAAIAMAHNLVLVTKDKMSAIKNVAGTEIQFDNWLS